MCVCVYVKLYCHRGVKEWISDFSLPFHIDLPVKEILIAAEISGECSRLHRSCVVLVTSWLGLVSTDGEQPQFARAGHLQHTTSLSG